MWNAIKRACRWTAGWIAVPFRWIGIKLGLIESDAQRTAREQQAREKSTKECAIRQALVEINTLIEYALDTLKNHIYDITEEKGLLYLYIAFSNLIAAAKAEGSSILQENTLQLFRPTNFFVIPAYDELAKNIFTKTGWRNEVDLGAVPGLLEQIKFNLLERLANKTGEGYLAKVHLNLLSEEEQPECNQQNHSDVLRQILDHPDMKAPLIKAIDSELTKNNEEFFQAVSAEDSSEDKSESPSWAGAPQSSSKSRSQAVIIPSKDELKLVRQKRLEVLLLRGQFELPGSSGVVAQNAERGRSPGPS